MYVVFFTEIERRDADDFQDVYAAIGNRPINVRTVAEPFDSLLKYQYQVGNTSKLPELNTSISEGLAYRLISERDRGANSVVLFRVVFHLGGVAFRRVCHLGGCCI